MLNYLPEISLDEVATQVFQFRCLDESEAHEVLLQVKQLDCWQSAPVRKGRHENSMIKLDEESRAAREIHSSQSPQLFSHFEGKIKAAVARAAEQLGATQLEPSELRLVCYEEGGFFKVHSDTGAGDRRHFAIVVYLNNDFEGGATIFPLLGCKIKPEPGKAIIFPADKLHRGDTVTGGSKYIAVMWLLDPLST